MNITITFHTKGQNLDDQDAERDLDAYAIIKDPSDHAIEIDASDHTLEESGTPPNPKHETCNQIILILNIDKLKELNNIQSIQHSI